MVEYDIGRYITIDEAREIVKECESKGAYQCPNHVREMIHEERKVFVPSLSKDRVRIKKKYEL